MPELTVMESEVIDGPTLRELADTANREHELVIKAGVSMVEHAIRVGEALSAARAQCEPGQWMQWVRENLSMKQAMVSRYIRIAHYQDELRARLPDSTVTIVGAERALRGLPAVIDPAQTGVTGYDGREEMQAEAQRLRSAGSSYREIADEFGVSTVTIYHWCNPDAAHRANEKRKQVYIAARAAARALEREERARTIKRAVRKAGKATAEAYSMAERMQDVLAQAQRETEDSEAREHLSIAGEHYRKMRDEIVRALGIT